MKIFTPDKKLNVLIALTMLAVGATLLSTFGIPPLFFMGKNEFLGDYGSFLGGVIGSITSLVTVYLVYQTFKLQKKLLKSQKKELKKTQDQLKRQQFETVFFNMLNMINTIGSAFPSISSKSFFMHFMDELKLNYTPVNETSSHDIYNKIIQALDERHSLGLFKEGSKFRDVNKDLIPNGKMIFQEWRRKDIRNEQEYIGELYLQLFYLNNSELSHFFRYIHGTVIYIIEEREIYGDESKYINMIQSQLTNHQLLVMFYNCLSTVSLTRKREPRIKNLFDKYEMFHNLPIQLLIRPNHQDFYPNTNFKQKHSEYEWTEADYKENRLHLAEIIR